MRDFLRIPTLTLLLYQKYVKDTLEVPPIAVFHNTLFSRKKELLLVSFLRWPSYQSPNLTSLNANFLQQAVEKSLLGGCAKGAKREERFAPPSRGLPGIVGHPRGVSPWESGVLEFSNTPLKYTPNRKFKHCIFLVGLWVQVQSVGRSKGAKR